MTFKCKFSGLILPLFGESEMDWPNIVRLILYLMGLGWTFLGVAVISDVFMAGIEKVTSSKKRVTDKETGRKITVYVWNATVANLTLMALGSSAPEILLSLIEITSDNFFLGPLGAGTIVGSAAFNLLVISAVCVCAIPDDGEGENFRYIKEVPVYIITSSCSIFAYLWLMFILLVTSPDVCEIWEAVLTFMFCPILVVTAYLADRGYILKYFATKTAGDYTEMNADHKQTIPDDASEEELAQISQQIRDAHDSPLTDAQVLQIMRVQYFQKRSRAYYRHAAMEAKLHGHAKAIKETQPLPSSVQEAISTSDDIQAEKAKKMVTFGFIYDKYAVLENIGETSVAVQRLGPSTCQASVKYCTKEGTAHQTQDYIAVEGTLVFEKGETEKAIVIKIVDDESFEEEECFYVHLSDAVICDDNSGCQAGLCDEHKVATIVIIDDDLPGNLRFKLEDVETMEGTTDLTVEVVVERFDGATGEISCQFKTDDMQGTAADVDYMQAAGCVEFKSNQQTATIPVVIKAWGRTNPGSFNVVLSEPKGTKFDSKTDGGADTCICHVTIKPAPGVKEAKANLLSSMRDRVQSANAISGARNWSQQFRDALFDAGGDDDEDADAPGGPSKMDWFMHIISIPWKLLFAFVPPVDYAGGWACFCGALCMIAVVTAIVGDMANLVGCCCDVLPETAAITFVALGTSLPDTFASQAAAMMDPHADACIGNVVGSNSINVFMGIGIAWTLAAFRWETGEPDLEYITRIIALDPKVQENVAKAMSNHGGNAVFVAPGGTLWFNLMVFSVNALCAIQHLYARRKKWGGELGGPKKGFMGQYFSGAFLVGQWFIYVTASIVFARLGDAVTYGMLSEPAAVTPAPGTR